MLDSFRADPDANRLPTPSGRIELWSEQLAAFDLEDCPPHAAWFEPVEWLGSRWRSASRCTWSPINRRTVCTAKLDYGRPAARGRWPTASRSGCTPTMPPSGAFAAATWSASSTTVGRHWPARS